MEIFCHFEWSSTSGSQLIVLCVENIQLLENYRTINEFIRCTTVYFWTHKSQIKMEYFEKLKLQLRRLGIFHWNSNSKAKTIAVATRCGLFVISIAHISTLAVYLIFEAQTPGEQAESLFSLLGTLLTLLWYTALVFKCEQYAKFLATLNVIIENSKFN